MATTKILLTKGGSSTYGRYYDVTTIDAVGLTPNLIEIIDPVTGLNAVIKDLRTSSAYNDINISLVPQTSGASVPATIAFNGDTYLKCIAFNGTTANIDALPCSMEVLHDYKEGTDIEFHVHWYPTNATVANVKWQLRYAWFNKGSAVPAGTTVSIVQATSGVAWQEQHAEIVISGTGKTMGSRFVFCLFRDPTDASDTYGANAAVTDMGLHYQRDSLGSRTAEAK